MCDLKMNTELNCDEAYLLCMALRVLIVEQEKHSTLLSLSEEDSTLLARGNAQTRHTIDLLEKFKAEVIAHHEKQGNTEHEPREPVSDAGMLARIKERLLRMLGPDAEVMVATTDPETAKRMMADMEQQKNKTKASVADNGDVVIPSKDTLPN